MQILGRPAGELRNTMRKGWAGPGWDPQQEADHGDAKDPYELSPGDRTAFQWKRDNQYLNAILERENVTLPPDSVSAWVGGTSKDQMVQKNIDNALYWYGKSKDATHSFTDGPLAGVAGFQDLPLVGGGANFPDYQDDAAAGNWMSNPDSFMGYGITKIFSPLEDFANQVTMAAPSKDGHTPIITPIKDFLSNLNEHGGQALHDTANKAEAAQFMTHSPRVPAGLTSEQRIQFLQKAANDYEKAHNPEGKDYVRQQTGAYPTPAYGFVMKVASSTMDPSIAFTGGAGALGPLAKGSTRMGALARGIGNEALQETAENAGIMGAFGALFGDNSQKYDSPWDWYGDAAKTMSKSFQPEPMTDDQSQFNQKMMEQNQRVDKAREGIGKANRAITKPAMPGHPSQVLGFPGG
jgi:hypothetical protein